MAVPNTHLKLSPLFLTRAPFFAINLIFFRKYDHFEEIILSVIGCMSHTLFSMACMLGVYAADLSEATRVHMCDYVERLFKSKKKNILFHLVTTERSCTPSKHNNVQLTN